ncbi:MAG: GNAT family N-acetyltransferase [Alkalibacterium sp.]|nr:GNAT family N-acetyltransferase [Alkalibacterium sp.]
MIELKPVSKHNYMTVVDLKVHPNQEDFVAPNSLSLLEAAYEDQKYPFAIYKDGTVVGFLMCSYYPADDAYPVDSWWLERLMVDKAHQGKGIGREALTLFLKEFKPDEQVTELRIGADPKNEWAIKLYESFGFKKEGVVEDENVYAGKWTI